MSVTPAQSRAALQAMLDARLEEKAAWLHARLAHADVESVGRMLLEAGPAVGRRPLVAAFAERDAARLDTALGPMPVGHWRTDEAVRTLLVAHVADLTERPFHTLYQLYDQGDTDARVAALRAVNLVNDDRVADGLEIIHDAGRTYLAELMSAGWTKSPFSSAHLSDFEFRKAVLKALFCDVPVEGFMGLEQRADAELAKSLCAYADERVAAGRPVPKPVWIVAALHPRPGLVARLIGMLENPLPDERQVAATALANARDSRALPFIGERLEREQDATVRAALQRAIEATPR